MLLKANVVTLAASAVLSAVGVFLLDSLEAVLIGAVSAIIGRSLWSEHRLNKLMGVRGSAVPVEEVLLTIAFVALVLNAPAWIAVMAYIALYAAYLFVNRQTTRALSRSIMRAFGH